MKNTAKIRRIQNEVKEIEKDKTSTNSMFEIKMVGDNMYKYDAIIYGPVDSLYQGFKFKLSIELPDEYPFQPPKVKFVTPIKHVNVNSSGDICLDILKDQWLPIQTIKTVLVSIILLLSEPNPDHPFDSSLAELYKRNKDEYLKTIKKFCVVNKIN